MPKQVVDEQGEVGFGHFRKQHKIIQGRNIKIKTRSDLATCIQDGTGKSGKGFAAVLAFLDVCAPNMIFLENVATAVSNDEDGYVRRELQSRNYFTRQLEFCAREYGSPASRQSNRSTKQRIELRVKSTMFTLLPPCMVFVASVCSGVPG